MMMTHGYLELKLSWEMFQKAPETLSDPERQRLSEIALKQDRIEQLILGSQEAANVIIPDASLSNRLDEIRKRYPSGKEFNQDMERNGLSQASLGEAVIRDMKVEAVLEVVASKTTPANAIDAEIYYRLHPEAFDRPEARRLRHILITFNNATEKKRATEQLTSLRTTLKSASQFGEAALRHSQCPTALEGGVLGVVKRRQLYPELEPAAFALGDEELSEVIESPVGMHLLRCDEILPSGMLPFPEVCPRIVELLTEKRRRAAQKEWIKGLAAPRAKQSTHSTSP